MSIDKPVKWIATWLKDEVFGIDLSLRCMGKEGGFRMEIPGTSAVLSLPDRFLSWAAADWLGVGTLPQGTVQHASLESLPEAQDRIGHSTVPVLFGDARGDKPLFEATEYGARLNLDVIGTLFFLMSRYEEVVVRERDKLGRFLSSDSFLGKAGLLHRAIGNEYIEILWAAMVRVWPGLRRVPRSFRVLPSHDMDVPSGYWNRRGILSRVRMPARLLLDGQPMRAMGTAVETLLYPHAGWRHDTVDSVDYLMDVAEENGRQSAFYYIPECTDEFYDPGIPLNHPQIKDQWRRIAGRGHEIGLHPGFRTHDRPERIARGAEIVRQALDALDIDQELVGGRQHYLRWEPDVTPQAWDRAGLRYDSTLSFVDHAGFRCGVCYEFPMFDVVECRVLSLRQRPLIVMECSVLNQSYMGLERPEDALPYMESLKAECRKYSGDFTLLWHNQRMRNEREREMFSHLLK